MSAIPQATRKRGRPVKGESATLRDELILKSAKLFRTQGYERTTVRDIAAAAGVQAGSWFYYFKTKQDILVAVMEQGMSNALARIEALDVENLPARDAHVFARNLVRGEARRAERAQRVGVDRAFAIRRAVGAARSAQHDVRDHRLAPLRMRAADHGRLRDGRMFGQHILDFLRIHARRRSPLPARRPHPC